MNPLRLGGLTLGLTLVLTRSPLALADSEATDGPLQLEVSERGPDLPWRLTIRNQGSELAHVSADPRLLWFEVQVPGKKKPGICRLPSELFPAAPPVSQDVPLKPGEAVTAAFDPRYYCFAADGQVELVPGALLKPRFGWPEKTKTTWRKGKRVEVVLKQPPPFVARVQGLRGAPSPEPIKVLKGQPWALGSSYAVWARAGLSKESTVDEQPLELRLSQGSDSEFELGTSVTVTLHNRSRHAERVYFPRELVTFQVVTQDGMEQCDPKPDLRAPDPLGFETLRPGGSTRLTSRLVELCPRGTFARPGLYLVHARFDASVSGEEYGIDAFVGRIASTQPVTIRIRKGDEKPRIPTMVRVPPAPPSDGDERAPRNPTP